MKAILKFQNLQLFFAALLAFNFAPGNDMVYAASRRVSQGIRAGVVSAAGIFASCFVLYFSNRAVFIYNYQVWLAFSSSLIAGAGY